MLFENLCDPFGAAIRVSRSAKVPMPSTTAIDVHGGVLSEPSLERDAGSFL